LDGKKAIYLKAVLYTAHLGEFVIDFFSLFRKNQVEDCSFSLKNMENIFPNI
jgi:hypothetical protein